MLLQDAFDDFVEWGQSHYSMRTNQTYTSLFKRFVKYMGKDTHVEDITIKEITKYVLLLNRKNYAESSVAFMVVSIKVFFRYLYMRRLIDWDYNLIRIPRYSSVHFPTVRTEEMKSMMANVKRKDFIGLRDRTVIRFLYATGLRVSELVSLDIGDMDTDIREAVVLTKKNKNRRLVVWDHETNDLLKKYIYERELHAKDESLFLGVGNNKYGKRISVRAIQRIIKKYRCGRGVVPHSFRSGLATDMLEGNVALPVIQKVLGHSSLNSLEPYVRVHNPHLKKEYHRVRG